MVIQSAHRTIPPSLAHLPFLFMRSEGVDREWHVEAAFAAAIAAEQADDTPRNTSRRIAWLICETGFQLARRGEDAATLPLARVRLSEALGVRVCRVKRTLAMLALSRTLAVEDGAIRILDWRRLCGAAHYDPVRLGLAKAEDEATGEPAEEAAAGAERQAPTRLTSAGDPACFA